MLNLEKIKMDYCVEQLNRAYRRTYSNMEQELGNVVIWSSHLALEIIANSDALYHNVEHTVTCASPRMESSGLPTCRRMSSDRK
jgi:hypothetical protein